LASAIFLAMRCLTMRHTLEAHAVSAFMDKELASDYPLLTRHLVKVVTTTRIILSILL
jgi:hypothetical protein